MTREKKSHPRNELRRSRRGIPAFETGFSEVRARARQLALHLCLGLPDRQGGAGGSGGGEDRAIRDRKREEKEAKRRSEEKKKEEKERKGDAKERRRETREAGRRESRMGPVPCSMTKSFRSMMHVRKKRI